MPGDSLLVSIAVRVQWVAQENFGAEQEGEPNMELQFVRSNLP